MKKIDVLLVEDEPVLAGIVKESLEKRDFIVHVASNGVEGWTMFKTVRPDVCVIDIMMPRKDGFTLVTEIRVIDDQLPIIILSARTQTQDVLKGLEIGADDYMKKPFSMEELILRLKGLVRRKTLGSAPAASPELLIGNYRFRHQYQELLLGSKAVFLSQREADLLLLLFQHKNELLERRLALIKLWGDDNTFNARSMDVYITRLRKHFKDETTVEIVNIRGYGYSLKM
ncbi:response regulator transcription factor [Pedobacter duraquae]|uniref:DNA-binding response OmpR family regulator n=1 Tax=Pedobacter duraquae TaxID=425511 RepID=A0A4R6IE87_9SPHI|nr:response regulator transcription factor [Pedobacter duraquae]TDO20284.1 DNA-binding response OmpR family regulator [Pedobacter duraquae]